MIVVTTDGRAVQDDRQPTLEVLQELTGKGYVCCVPQIFAICDEDAPAKGRARNRTASNWAQYDLWGDVVFLTHKEWKVFISEPKEENATP